MIVFIFCNVASNRERAVVQEKRSCPSGTAAAKPSAKGKRCVVVQKKVRLHVRVEKIALFSSTECVPNVCLICALDIMLLDISIDRDAKYATRYMGFEMKNTFLPWGAEVIPVPKGCLTWFRKQCVRMFVLSRLHCFPVPNVCASRQGPSKTSARFPLVLHHGLQERCVRILW